MFCSNCGDELADGSKFCSGCGAKVGEVKKKKGEGKGKSETKEKRVKSIPVAAQTYFEKGKKYQEKEDYDNAYDAYQEAIEIAPNFLEAQKKFIEVCLITENIYDAEKIIDDVISNNPDDYEILFLRGKLNKLNEEIDNAIIDFEIVTKIQPDFIDAYKELLLIYADANSYDNIIKIANAAIKIASNDSLLFILRGNAFFFKGSYDKALSDFNKSLEIIPDNSRSIFSIGVCYLKKADYNNALIFFNRFLDIFPDNADVICYRAQCLIYKEDYNNAIEDFETAEKLYGDKINPLLYKYRALARYKMGWYDLHQDEIMKDFIQISNNIEDDDYNELEFFREIILNRYRKAINEFYGKKETYLIAERSKDFLGRNKYEDFLLLMFTTKEPKTINRSNKGVMLFIYDYAWDYFSCLRAALGRSKADIYSVQKNTNHGTPKWCIFNAGSGFFYFKEKSGKNKISWSLSKDISSCRYEILEDAFKDYEKLLHSIDISSDFKNIFIVGIGGTEEICEAEALFIKGKNYSDKEEYEHAIKEFTAAIKIEQNYTNAYKYRCWAYKQIRDYKNAFIDIQKVLEVEPENTYYQERLCDIYEGLGNECLDKKEYKNAIANFSSAIEILDKISDKDYGPVYRIDNGRLIPISKEMRRKEIIQKMEKNQKKK